MTTSVVERIVYVDVLKLIAYFAANVLIELPTDSQEQSVLVDSSIRPTFERIEVDEKFVGANEIVLGST